MNGRKHLIQVILDDAWMIVRIKTASQVFSDVWLRKINYEEERSLDRCSISADNFLEEVDISPACVLLKFCPPCDDPLARWAVHQKGDRRRTDRREQSHPVVISLVSIICHLGVRDAPALPLHWTSHFVTVLSLLASLLMFYHILSLLALHCHSNKCIIIPFPKQM